MKIDDTLVRYLEELSRLALTDDEREDMTGELASILAYMERIGELDTAGVEELSHPFPEANRFREDAVTPSAPREDILAGAPQQKDGCFRVPKTVE